jgi:hypothetical protein
MNKDFLPLVVPAQAGTDNIVPLGAGLWIPACAGMTEEGSIGVYLWRMLLKLKI